MKDDMMGIFGSKAPPAPPPPPPPPNPGTPATTSQQAGEAERSAAAAAQGSGFDNTVTNTGGSLGQANAPTASKQLTGQ